MLDAEQAKKDAIKAEKEYTKKQEEAAEKETKRQKDKEEADKKRKAAEEKAEQALLHEARMKILKKEFETKDIEITKKCIDLKVDEARFLKVYHKLREEGWTQEQAMQKLKEMASEQLKYENKLRDEIKEHKLEEKEFLKKYNEMLNKGISEADAYSQVQKDLNEALKKRKEAEEKAIQESDETGKTAKQLKKDGKAIAVTLSANAMGDLGEKVEDKLNFKDWQRKNRDEARKVRDQKNNMKIDQAKMTKALKGEMPKAEAEEWMKYAKQKYTPDQMRELGKLAMNKELLSKSEQKKQLTCIEKMAREIATALATK